MEKQKDKPTWLTHVWASFLVLPTLAILWTLGHLLPYVFRLLERVIWEDLKSGQNSTTMLEMRSRVRSMLQALQRT